MGKTPFLFISYRRDDTLWIVRALHRYLAERLGDHNVFVDRVEIRLGDDWAKRIESALDDATVIIPIIGSRWLTLTDRFNSRRIDREDDWVRKEIVRSLADSKTVIPLYVDGAQRVRDSEALPHEIRDLLKFQSIVLSEDYWDAGLAELLRQLQANGFTLHQTANPMPEKRKKVEPLTKQELEKVKEDLPSWSVTTNYVSSGLGAPAFPRTELYREYRFKTFVKATRFMADISPAIAKEQHHPRWENMWTTVRVWLSTWDIEFRPSHFDVRLARLLDKAYTELSKAQE